jgi:hypothetical protein
MDRLNPSVLVSEFHHGHAANPEIADTIPLRKTERLPFTIRIAADDEALQKAVTMRQMDGGPLGTMRIQTNEFAPLAVEQSVQLPDWLQGTRMAEATRLGVAGGTIGRMVKIGLCKALFLYCQQEQIDWMVITARSPLDREYEAMLFGDVFGKNEFLPMSHVGGLPHRVMAKPVAVARERWAAAGHPLYKFMIHTYHPDIDFAPADLSFGRETVGCLEASQIGHGR